MYRLCFLLPLLGLAACASFQPEPVTLEYPGVFELPAEPDDPLYCYCETAGYLNACGDVRIPLCLDKRTMLEPCTEVTLMGYYQYFTPDRPTEGECTDEEAPIFVVTEWKCRN